MRTRTNRKGGKKQQHPTEDAALKAASRRARNNGKAAIYRCPTTKAWHVTTHPYPGKETP